VRLGCSTDSPHFAVREQSRMTISKLLHPVYVAKIKKLARGELQNPSQKLDNLGNPHGACLVNNHDQYRACGPGGHAAAQAQSGLPPRDSEARLQATTASYSPSTGAAVQIQSVLDRSLLSSICPLVHGLCHIATHLRARLTFQ
jgi:hypothetical protein